MSHVTNVELEIKDLGALQEACKHLGLEFRQNQKTYRWFGRHVGDYPLPQGFKKEDMGHCEHAISIPGNTKAYEVGVVKRRDGKEGYLLQWDFYGRGFGLQDKIGNNAIRIRDEYMAALSSAKLRAKRFVVKRTMADNGKIVLVATR